MIDGGHGYNVVKSDTENALRMINRDRGVIIWHDAVDYGVGEYLPELDPSHLNYRRHCPSRLGFRWWPARRSRLQR